jgi:hypothetical protein
MAWGLVLDDSFVHADTVAGAAGSTTGVGTTPAIGTPNGWTDLAGSIYSIASGLLVANPPGGSFATQLLLRPAGEIVGADQRVVATTEPGAGGGQKWAVVLRWASAGNFYLLEFNDVNKDVNLYAVLGGSPTLVDGRAIAGVTVGHQYRVDVSATGLNPTTLGVTVTDLTAAGGDFPVTYTHTDSSSVLQAGGLRYGLDAYNVGAKFSRVQGYQLAVGPAATGAALLMGM